MGISIDSKVSLTVWQALKSVLISVHLWLKPFAQIRAIRVDNYLPVGQYLSNPPCYPPLVNESDIRIDASVANGFWTPVDVPKVCLKIAKKNEKRTDFVQFRTDSGMPAYGGAGLKNAGCMRRGIIGMSRKVIALRSFYGVKPFCISIIGELDKCLNYG